jgi:hypothetical protein
MRADEVERAQLLVELDRDAEARALITTLLADAPDDPQLLALLAQACLGTHDYDAARRAALAAVRSAPDSEWPLRLLALAEARAGAPARAVAAADRATAVDPHNWLTHLARVQVDLIGGVGTVDGEAAARAAVRIAPTESEAHRALGNIVLLRRPRRGAVEAEAALTEALRLQPDSAPAHNDLARVHLRRRRRLGRAVAGFARAAALEPNDDIAAGNLQVAGARALGVVHLVLWLTLFTTGFALDGTRWGGRAESVVAVAVDTVLLVGFGLLFWRGTRPRTVRLARLILRRDRFLAAWAGFLALSFGLLAASAFAGGSNGTLAALAFWALFAGTVLTWVRTRRLRGRRR